MAHQVKEIAAKPGDLSSNPRTQILKKRTNFCKLFSDSHVCHGICMPLKHTHKHTQMRFLNRLLHGS